MGELERLYFGRDDAESDIGTGLLRAGFLRTSAFDAVLSGRKQIIIGRRGSGKTAICVTLAAANTGEYEASLVTPDAVSLDEIHQYELQGITSEIAKSLLWRYVLGIQVAKYVVAHAAAMHAKPLPGAVEALRRFLRDNEEVIDPRLHQKFWHSIQRLKSLKFGAFGANVGIDLDAPSEGLRTSNKLEVIERHVMAGLNGLDCPGGHPWLLLLVDGLDQVWSNAAQSTAMVSGLLLAAKHVARSFPGVRCVVSLPTDIYESLRFAGKEKFRSDEMHLDWTPSGLLDVALARARASVGRNITFDEMWGTLFPPDIAGEPTADYIISRTLRRPRDIITFANFCRDTAEKNWHVNVTARDVTEAEVQFSQSKLQDLADEYRISYPFLDDLFALFRNSSYIITRQRFEERFSARQQTLRSRFRDYASSLTADTVIDTLYEIAFLGVRRSQHISYSYEDTTRVSPDEYEFHVHPCFRQALRSTAPTSLVAIPQRTQQVELSRIGLWGAPGSGKTTFLAALNVAVSRSAREVLIYGADDTSTNFLAENTALLTTERRFPAATQLQEQLSWTVQMGGQEGPPRQFREQASQGISLQFGIDVIDAPGRSFEATPDSDYLLQPNALGFLNDDDDDADSFEPEPGVIDALADCDGIIWLFDPLRELSRGDNFNYFYGTLLRMAQRRFARAKDRGRLPQYVAACATKFDDPEIYHLAKRGGHVSFDDNDPYLFPRVLDHSAADFFADLCRLSDTGNGDLMLRTVGKYFQPDRVRYFITSAIGFYAHPGTGRFTEDDYQNIVQLSDGVPRIRGMIRPINILEPLLWMCQSLATAR